MEQNPVMGAGEDCRQCVLRKVYQVCSDCAGEGRDEGEEARPPRHMQELRRGNLQGG